MSTSQAASNGQSRGTNLLPASANPDTILPGKGVAIQMPRRPLDPSAEEGQRNSESDLWFDEVNRRVTAQLDGLGGQHARKRPRLIHFFC
jgi:hypothetical protein